METSSRNVFVGTVTLVLLAVLAAFIVWITNLSEGEQKAYDIFFKQSVEGLSKGSEVTFSGVPSGQVSEIELWPRDPSFVRVRIQIDKKVPILVGTTATIQGSFTGVSNIQLQGASSGAAPITEIGPEGVPVIPTKRGGLGEILNSAPVLLERLATVTERLNELLSDKNQQSIRNILAHTDTLTGNLADASPELKPLLADLRLTIVQARATLANFEKVAGTANEQLTSANGSIQAALNSARQAADALKRTLDKADPAVDQLSTSTIPQATATLRELREATRSLRNITEKIDERGAGALMGGPALPDYKP